MHSGILTKVRRGVRNSLLAYGQRKEAQALLLSFWDMVEDLWTRAIRLDPPKSQPKFIGLHTFADIYCRYFAWNLNRGLIQRLHGETLGNSTRSDPEAKRHLVFRLK